MKQVISFNIQKCFHCGDEIPSGAYYWVDNYDENDGWILCDECANFDYIKDNQV